MKLWLTKCDGGRYCLTALRPVIARIRGTERMDAFEAVGDPLTIRHLCEDGVRSGLEGAVLPPLTPRRVRLILELLPHGEKTDAEN